LSTRWIAVIRIISIEKGVECSHVAQVHHLL
jgi:hypothetical protein